MAFLAYFTDEPEVSGPPTLTDRNSNLGPLWTPDLGYGSILVLCDYIPATPVGVAFDQFTLFDRAISTSCVAVCKSSARTVVNSNGGLLCGCSSVKYKNCY